MITDSVSSLCHMFSLPAVSVTHVILGSLLHYKFVEALVLACPLLLQAWAKDPHNLLFIMLCCQRDVQQNVTHKEERTSQPVNEDPDAAGSPLPSAFLSRYMQLGLKPAQTQTCNGALSTA